MSKQNNNHPLHKPKLTEGLISGDLNDCVDPLFAIDQYKSKMGSDRDVIVLSFKVNDKSPAIDLMEFIEKGYPFVLDADISAGEERDGQFSVFVELQRSMKVPSQIRQLLDGLSQLCDINKWRFRYYKDPKSYIFSEDLAADIIPLTIVDYNQRLLDIKNRELGTFFNKGAIESVKLNNDDSMSISKPYAESLVLKFIDHGKYSQLKESLSGGMQLDSASYGQSLYLQKFLGNYEIFKIDNKFLIRNGDDAVIVEW